MKENEVTDTTALERKLRERLLLARRVEGDRLALADAVLLAALGGSRALTANERAALEASPLTVRRLRQLAMERRAASAAAGDGGWSGSGGMLRAADSGAAPTRLVTDDGYWTLHFGGAENDRVVILQLAASAPFAARLIRERPLLRVLDGGGAIILEGRLDTDGECEGAWRFEAAPAVHMQRYGAAFTVEPLAPG
jgi:hypothetical protein